MAYDHGIAYDRFAFFVVDMKVMLYHISAIELRHAKKHLDTMCRALQPCGCNIIYFIRPHTDLIMCIMFYFEHSFGSFAIPQAC